MAGIEQDQKIWISRGCLESIEEVIIIISKLLASLAPIEDI